MSGISRKFAERFISVQELDCDLCLLLSQDPRSHLPAVTRFPSHRALDSRVLRAPQCLRECKEQPRLAVPIAHWSHPAPNKWNLIDLLDKLSTVHCVTLRGTSVHSKISLALTHPSFPQSDLVRHTPPSVPSLSSAPPSLSDLQWPWDLSRGEILKVCAERNEQKDRRKGKGGRDWRNVWWIE